MDDLSPTSPIPRGGEPVPPEVHRRHQLIERLLLLAHPELGRGAGLLQGEDGNPALLQGELSDRVAFVDHQGLGGTEVERQLRRCEEHTISNRRDGVGLRAVVEPGGRPHTERHRAPYALHAADQALRITGRRVPQRHEVLNLADSLFGEESGDEHIRVGKVELPRPGGDRRRESKEASLTGVEEGAEDTRRVEGRAAKPIDGPVGPDEGHAVKIPHEAVVSDRQVLTPAGRTRIGRR